jgi:periplasmic divalent cation tolerance protein
VLAIFKTRADVLPAFEQALTELHPYDVPEIIALDPAHVAEPYRYWLISSVALPDQ